MTNEIYSRFVRGCVAVQMLLYAETTRICTAYSRYTNCRHALCTQSIVVLNSGKMARGSSRRTTGRAGCGMGNGMLDFLEAGGLGERFNYITLLFSRFKCQDKKDNTPNKTVRKMYNIDISHVMYTDVQEYVHTRTYNIIIRAAYHAYIHMETAAAQQHQTAAQQQPHTSRRILNLQSNNSP